jgi:hypothetical protein
MKLSCQDAFEWFVIEKSSSGLLPGAVPVRFGPFMSEAECSTVLHAVQRTSRFNHSIFDIEKHKQKDRRDRRVKVRRLVSLSEITSNHILQTAYTVDVSITGVRLAGMKGQWQIGAVYTLHCDGRQAPFQVVWAGSGPTENQIGMECLAPELNIWGLDLSQMTEEERLAREIGRARAVQNRLFPQQPLPLQSLDYSGHCIQARTVGGDYYDFLAVGTGEVAFVVADASGKGIAAALLMSNFHGGLHSQRFHQGCRHLPQLLSHVNRHLYNYTDSDRYISVFLASYSDVTRKLCYVNCGHTPPLWLRHNGDVKSLDATGTLIGLFPDWDGYCAELQIEPGDILSMHTDGITEATDSAGEEFGQARLANTLQNKRHLGAASLLQEVEQAVEQFRSDEQHDDATLVIACCR